MLSVQRAGYFHVGLCFCHQSFLASSLSFCQKKNPVSLFDRIWFKDVFLPGVAYHRHKYPLPPGSDVDAFNAYPWFALFLDSHDSHIYDIEVLREAYAAKILFINFPGHCTHLLQPLDSGVFTAFKERFRDNTTWLNCALLELGLPLQICFFARLAAHALSESLTVQSIESGRKAFT